MEADRGVAPRDGNVGDAHIALVPALFVSCLIDGLSVLIRLACVLPCCLFVYVFALFCRLRDKEQTLVLGSITCLMLLI